VYSRVKIYFRRRTPRFASVSRSFSFLSLSWPRCHYAIRGGMQNLCPGTWDAIVIARTMHHAVGCNEEENLDVPGGCHPLRDLLCRVIIEEPLVSHTTPGCMCMCSVFLSCAVLLFVATLYQKFFCRSCAGGGLFKTRWRAESFGRSVITDTTEWTFREQRERGLFVGNSILLRLVRSRTISDPGF